LVLVVVGPLRGHRRPHALLVLGAAGARDHRDDLVPHLDLAVRVGDEVLVPARVLRRAALRRDEHEVVAVASVDERVLPDLSRLSSLPAQDQAAGAVPVVSCFPAGRFVLADVLVTEEAEVGHGCEPATSRAATEPHRARLPSAAARRYIPAP